MNIEIIRIDEEELFKETWIFCIIDHAIVLDRYIVAERKNKKHGFQYRGRYDRLMNNKKDIPDNLVPLPDDVKNEALEIYTNKTI